MSSTKKVEKAPYDPYNLNLIFTVLIVIQAIIALVIFFIPPFTLLDLNQKINIFLSWAIVSFTIIGATSTWLNYAVVEKRNKIEDYRIELEKAYGPLYSILNQKDREEPVPEPHCKDPNDIRVHLLGDEKDDLDKIFKNYPFMFEPILFSFWQDVIQNPKGDIAPQHREFWIPFDFVNMVNEEYDRRLNDYNSLIGKTKKR